MKILFLSNYYTHHQRPLCEALDLLTGHNFTFVATEPFAEERRRMGWDMQSDVSFVKEYHEAKQDCDEAILDADLVLLGSAPLSLIRQRLKRGKPVFFYAERIYKNGYQPWKWLPRLFRFWDRYGKHRSLYLLAASGYAAADYARHGTFLGKSYRWGYFPEAKQYDISTLMAQKDPTRLLWCGRFLDWKHPEAAVAVARRLRDEGYHFRLDLIGSGPLEEKLQQDILRNDLQDCVRLLGTMPTEEVRTHMETAGIYLFTSDFHEGWGAVLNEAMNSGCSVVASHAVGAAPFLLEHGANGLIYRSGDADSLYRNVKFLLGHPLQQQTLGCNAYRTITEEWNAAVAARRLIALAEALQHKRRVDMYPQGPCSKAPVLKNHWFKG